MYRRLPYGSVPSYAPLSWDSHDPETVEAAFKMRLMKEVPKARPGVLQRLSAFVDDFLLKNVPQVDPLGFEEWLATTGYDENRKNQLRAENEDLRGSRPTRRQAQKVKSFVKTESYPEWKYPRMINSRCDAFKAYSGPFFKAIEQAVYQLKPFVKHTPVPERPALIAGIKKAGARYYQTDYSAFECHFTVEVMRALELRLYRWCLKNHPDDAEFICRTLSGVNQMGTMTGVRASVRARRMSGDMCTSLGNGFSNLMITLFLIAEKGGHYDGFVEGDDGVFATDVVLTAQDYLDCGFTIKIDEVDDPCHASFCGMIFAESGEIIRDPRRFIETFGWTHSMISAGPTIMHQLLRAKALSACYETPQCPIVGQIARSALEVTRGYAPRFVADGYHQAPPDEWPLPDFAPSDDTRLLFERLFGVSVADQLRVEESIRAGHLDAVLQVLPPHVDVEQYALNYVEVT